MNMKEKKTENIVSGSLPESPNEKTKLSESTSDLLTTLNFDNIENLSKPENVDALIKKLLDTEIIEQQLQHTCLPTYSLKSEKSSIWLLSLTSRTFSRVSSASEVIIVEKIDDDNTCCLIGNDTYSVPNELIYCVGWN